MNIDWKRQYSKDAHPIGWVGTDADGNIFDQGELRETTSVTMKDGRTGGGWTPKDALESAMSKPVPPKPGPAGLADRLMKAADEINSESDFTMPGYAELFQEAANAVVDLGLAAHLHKEAYERLLKALEVAVFDDYQREVDWQATFESFMKLPRARAYINSCIAEWLGRHETPREG